MTITNLKRQLLSKLDTQGFCQNYLIAVVEDCSDWLRDYYVAGVPSGEMLYVYLVREIANDIQSWMEAMEPIETTRHDSIETAIVSSLINAIKELDNQNVYETNDAMCVLLEAFNKTP